MCYQDSNQSKNNQKLNSKVPKSSTTLLLTNSGFAAVSLQNLANACTDPEVIDGRKRILITGVINNVMNSATAADTIIGGHYKLKVDVKPLILAGATEIKKCQPFNANLCSSTFANSMEIAIESIQDPGVRLPTYYRNNNVPEIVACGEQYGSYQVHGIWYYNGYGMHFVHKIKVGTNVREFGWMAIHRDMTKNVEKEEVQGLRRNRFRTLRTADGASNCKISRVVNGVVVTEMALSAVQDNFPSNTLLRGMYINKNGCKTFLKSKFIGFDEAKYDDLVGNPTVDQFVDSTSEYVGDAMYHYLAK